jgi:poly(3-hydroxybutyrate) depolymerase
MPATAAPYLAYDFTRFMMGMAAAQAHMTAAQATMMLAPVRALANIWGVPNMVPDKVKIQVSNDARTPAEIVLSLTNWDNNWRAVGNAFNRAARESTNGFDISAATIQGVQYPVKVKTVASKPFANLLEFDSGHDGPSLYIAVPISGHGATLAEDTVQSALNGGFGKVYVYDTKDAKNVPLSKGRYGLDELIDQQREFLKILGPKTHVLAICQATVAMMAAVASLSSEQKGDPVASLTLMAGPINPEASNTDVSQFAKSKPLSEFRDLLMEVPSYYPGAGRKIHAGFSQLMGFMSMNMPAHVATACDLFNHNVLGTTDSADYQKKNKFADEYYRKLKNLPAELYIDTIERIFINNDITHGRFKWHGKPVDFSALKCPLLTIEGAKDDICSEGQTMFAHEILSTPQKKGNGFHYTAPDVGHYGVFAGSKSKVTSMAAMFGFIRNVIRDKGEDCGPDLDGNGNIVASEPDLRSYTKDMLNETLSRQKDIWVSHCNEKKNNEIITMCTPVRTPLPRFELAA